MELPSAPGSPPADLEDPVLGAGGLQFPTEAISRSSSQSSTAVIYTHPEYGYVTTQPEPGDSPRKVSCVEPGSGTMTVVAGGESEVLVSGHAVVTAQVSKPLFKKVKVETEGPLKRGRWTCVDFKKKPEKIEKPIKEKKIAKSKKSVTKSLSNNSSEGSTSRPPSAGPPKEDFSRSQTPNLELENVTRDSEVTMSRSEVMLSRPASPVVPILTDGFDKVSVGQMVKLADGQLAQVSLTILTSAPPEMATPLNIVVPPAAPQELNQVRLVDGAHHQGILRPQYQQQPGRMSQDGFGQIQRSAAPSPRIEHSQVSSLQQQQHSDEPSQQQSHSQNQFSHSSSGSSRLQQFATSVSSSIIGASIQHNAQSLVSTSQNQTLLQPISHSRPARMGASMMVDFSSATENGNIDYEKEKPDRTRSTDNGQRPIDSKIEQALDLVKNHLTNSVRSELEDMKEKMRKLQDTAASLTVENEFMKSKLSPEVLSQLPLGQPLPTSSRAISGSERTNGTSNGTERTNGTVNGTENGTVNGTENTNGAASGSENTNGNGSGSGRSSGSISPEN